MTSNLQQVVIDSQHDSPDCTHAAECSTYKDLLQKLMGRYVGSGQPFDGQIIAAWLDLGLTLEAYLSATRKRYKGNVVRDARRADRAGYVCAAFPYSLHVPDIVEINHSSPTRCGRPMTEAYQRGVEEMGGAPATMIEFHWPDCPLHYDLWWGVFQPDADHRQGEVAVRRRLVGYIRLRRNGDYAHYAQILGHADHLKHGIMYRLHFAIMEWILSSGHVCARGLKTLFYAGFHQGREGLQLWKKKTLFEPGLLIVNEPAAKTPAGLSP